MIKLNKLETTEKGRYLHINANIIPASYSEEMYFTYIRIATGDAYKAAGGFNSKTVLVYEENLDNTTGHFNILDKIIDCNNEKALIPLPNWDSDFLVIQISTSDNFIGDPSCGEDKIKFEYTLYDPYKIYEGAYPYMKSLGDNCNIDKNFINYILRTKQFETAIYTGNINKAIEIYNELFKTPKAVTTTYNCGCHG